jgi:hypothetical protein
MHELRRKERSTVDRALSSTRVLLIQLHRNHSFLWLAIYSRNLSDTLTLEDSSAREMESGYRSRLLSLGPYHRLFLCVSRTLRGLHIAPFLTWYFHSSPSFGHADARLCTLSNGFELPEYWLYSLLAAYA